MVETLDRVSSGLPEKENLNGHNGSNGRLEVLDTFTIYQQGGFRRVVEYIRGWYPELGKLHIGHQGQETIIERTILTPIKTFNVTEKVNTNGHHNGSSSNGKIV